MVHDRFVLRPDSGIPIAEQLSQQLLWLIASGLIPAGELLPPIRELAVRLDINLHTVRAAYRRLDLRCWPAKNPSAAC